MQIQTYTIIFLVWVFSACQRRNFGNNNYKEKKKNFSTVLENTNVWNHYTCMGFLQSLWHLLLKPSHSVVKCCWILWDGMSSLSILCKLPYTVVWLWHSKYPDLFYWGMWYYPVWVWLCQLLPSCAETLEDLLACLLAGVTCNKWGGLLFLNCRSLVNDNFTCAERLVVFRRLCRCKWN